MLHFSACASCQGVANHCQGPDPQSTTKQWSKCSDVTLQQVAMFTSVWLKMHLNYLSKSLWNSEGCYIVQRKKENTYQTCVHIKFLAHMHYPIMKISIGSPRWRMHMTYSRDQKYKHAKHFCGIKLSKEVLWKKSDVTAFTTMLGNWLANLLSGNKHSE